MTVDHLAQARASLAAATGDVSPRVRALHLAVSRASFDKARRELEELEILLKANEARLAIDGVGE